MGKWWRNVAREDFEMATQIAGMNPDGVKLVLAHLDRIDEEDKNWKFSFGDLEERKLWDKYMDAYEDMIPLLRDFYDRPPTDHQSQCSIKGGNFSQVGNSTTKKDSQT